MTAARVSAQTADETQRGDVVVTAKAAHLDVESLTPQTTVTSDQIALSGTQTLEQILQTIPAVGFQGINSTAAGGFGVYFVDLRSLNFNRTLTVVDGYRFVVSGIKTDEAVDLNNVPLALIDQIEIRRAGSEPLFGADAVAGVVDVKIKKNFNGLLLNLYGGVATPGGDATGEANVTWGHNFDRGNVTINLGYFSRDRISQSSRRSAADPITDASIRTDGSIATTIGVPATIGGHAVSADGSIDDVFYAAGPALYRPYEATDNYNFGRAQDIQGSLRRASATLLAHYEVAPHTVASVQMLFSQRQSDLKLPPQILGLAGTSKNPEGFVIPPEAGGSPYDEPVGLQRVMSEVGAQNAFAFGYTYRVVAALQGKLGRLDWNLSYDRGESRTTYKIRNSVNLTRANELASCVPDTGCMSADFFGPGSLSAAAAGYIRYEDVSRSRYTEDVGQFSLGTNVAKLPGGELRAELGGEVRREAGYTHMDPVVLAGDQATPDAANTDGSYHSTEAYLDVNWPLLADLPWAKSLVFETAVRFTHFNLFGSYPTWKAAGSYAPNATIRLRATVGLARRQPAITEAFAGLSATATAVQDPCDSVSGMLSNPVVARNCASQGLAPDFTQNTPLINIASGGNIHLTPEVSHNLTYGAVLTPSFSKGLSIAVDYYRYDIHNAINSLADTDANFIPDSCYQSENLSSPLCGLIERTASGPNAGQINRILALDSNIAALFSDGIDFDINYNANLLRNTKLSIVWQGNYLLNHILQSEGKSTQTAGYFSSLINSGSYAHFKSLLAATVHWKKWTFGYRVHYIGGAKVLDQDPAVTPFASAPAVWYHDLVVSYSQNHFIYTLGVNNLSDRRPPTLLDGQSNTDLNTYDIDGPFVYFRLSAAF